MKSKHRKRKLKQYSKLFCDIVRNDYPSLKGGNDYPTLKFDKVRYSDVAGVFLNDHKTILITDYFKEKPHILKIILRHECLHFILCNAGRDFDDEDPLFLLLADIYNANPYKLEDDNVREKFTNIIEEVIKAKAAAANQEGAKRA